MRIAIYSFLSAISCGNIHASIVIKATPVKTIVIMASLRLSKKQAFAQIKYNSFSDRTSQAKPTPIFEPIIEEIRTQLPSDFQMRLPASLPSFTEDLELYAFIPDDEVDVVTIGEGDYPKGTLSPADLLRKRDRDVFTVLVSETSDCATEDNPLDCTVGIVGVTETTSESDIQADDLPSDSVDITPIELSEEVKGFYFVQDEDYQPKTYEFEHDTFCTKFPFNSHCQQKPMEIIQLNLERSGEDDEWIHLKKIDSTIELSHRTKVRDDLVSTITDEAVGLIPLPSILDFLPFDVVPDINKYNWEDHQVTKVTFKSDRPCWCVEGLSSSWGDNRRKTPSCIVTGKKTLDLPEGTDIFQGLFTIEYQEKDLMRSLSLRISADVEATIVDTITISIPQKVP